VENKSLSTEEIVKQPNSTDTGELIYIYIRIGSIIVVVVFFGWILKSCSEPIIFPDFMK